uniref:LuxR family transcriptional regulator n=1 Tax=Thermosporothrix sp. COM3 TaxID=2490863 RepID=A0A455SGI4_9CHLR|nr:hypothetical protein KTC_12190 [Thermosporothrix sp. COM3]
MPRSPLHILRWSSERHQYELVTQHHLEQHFHTEHQWFLWLETATSFSFQGASGRLNVYKEARARGGTYWYAYAPASKRTRKRYLGQTANLTFERLEEAARALNSSSPETTSPPQPVEQPVILRTKLSPPHLPVMAIRRERLHTRLDAAESHRLTLVSASAGWGKTTLLSAWAAQAPERVAWLSLDELDNDPVRFWLSVLAALRTRLPAIGKHTQMMLNAQQPPALTTIIMTLLHDLETLAEPLFLLLDDYHHITEQSIHDTMLFLLEHLPPHLHLILVSRIDPPFALSRLRLHGQLLELRDADVRFHEDEAASFLSQTMGLTLEANDVHLLVRRTAGWVAGLQLAAFSIQHYEDRSEFIRAFTGGHRSLLDYVQEEILTGLPPALHDFLLQTSLLKSITAPLCQAVTHETRSQELLEAIERANLFVVPLDRERRWYRIHDLFREALQRRLKATQPELVPLLHQRAARWYEEQGARQEAIAHALDGADYDYAIALMQQRVEVAWLRGEAQNLYHWIMALPETYIRAHADFVLTATLYLLNTAASVSHPQHQSTLDRVKQMITVHLSNDKYCSVCG